jgi:hypothetical protein
MSARSSSVWKIFPLKRMPPYESRSVAQTLKSPPTRSGASLSARASM